MAYSQMDETVVAGESHVHGETDDFCWNITKDPLHPTLLQQMGIDHNRLVYPYRGLDQKHTGVEPHRS